MLTIGHKSTIFLTSICPLEDTKHMRKLIQKLFSSKLMNSNAICQKMMSKKARKFVNKNDKRITPGYQSQGFNKHNRLTVNLDEVDNGICIIGENRTKRYNMLKSISIQFPLQDNPLIVVNNNGVNELTRGKNIINSLLLKTGKSDICYLGLAPNNKIIGWNLLKNPEGFNQRNLSEISQSIIYLLKSSTGMNLTKSSEAFLNRMFRKALLADKSFTLTDVYKILIDKRARQQFECFANLIKDWDSDSVLMAQDCMKKFVQNPTYRKLFSKQTELNPFESIEKGRNIYMDLNEFPNGFEELIIGMLQNFIKSSGYKDRLFLLLHPFESFNGSVLGNINQWSVPIICPISPTDVSKTAANKLEKCSTIICPGSVSLDGGWNILESNLSNEDIISKFNQIKKSYYNNSMLVTNEKVELFRSYQEYPYVRDELELKIMINELQRAQNPGMEKVLHEV